MILILIILLAFWFVTACEEKPVKKQDCTTVKKELILRNGKEIILPASGKAVMESHYITDQDDFKRGEFPRTKDEKIKEHLDASCNKLGKKYCSDIYNAPHSRQWTPPEGGGQYGQGSRGLHRLSIESEIWAVTMNLKDNFKPDTRLLITFGNKSIVASIGHEIGPSTNHLIGMSPEAHWYLGTENESFVEIELLANQDLPFGPIICR